MNALYEQLVHAYRREEALYARVLELVQRQDEVMAAAPDPSCVLELCGDVERLMADIAAVEEAVGPAKKRWEETREDPKGELRAVLTSIEAIIAQVSEVQERVQRRLLDHIERQRQQTESARASVNASRARRLYRAG
ncbi:MAG: hypothetical protein AMK73_00730 [Planctomycetes bacterium SM23_32]|nr:MAG: hypothetical protein AMK73_00730 [Planctomycetes bacterium SM23_32]